MRLTRQQWLNALTDPPNYHVQDFSVGRIELLKREHADDVEPPINVILIEGVHEGTGLEVTMTLRIPDAIVPFLSASVQAMEEAI